MREDALSGRGVRFLVLRSRDVKHDGLQHEAVKKEGVENYITLRAYF